MTTFWITTIAILLVVPAAAVLAAARFLKPKVRGDTGPLGRAILILGLPFSLGMAIGSALVSVDGGSYGDGNTVELEVRISDFEAREDSWINFETPDEDLTFQVSSSLEGVFAHDAFVEGHDPRRLYTLRADRDMIRLATGRVALDEIGFFKRFELLLFHIFNDRDLVWVYEVRSGSDTYLGLGDANAVRERQKWFLRLFGVAIFFIAFVADVLIVAGLYGDCSRLASRTGSSSLARRPRSR